MTCVLYNAMQNSHVSIFSQTYDEYQHEVKDETSTYTRHE